MQPMSAAFTVFEESGIVGASLMADLCVLLLGERLTTIKKEIAHLIVFHHLRIEQAAQLQVFIYSRHEPSSRTSR